MSRRALWTLGIVTLLSASTTRADWPIPRHDARRTATAGAGASGITRPAPYWRTYLGGSLARRGYLARDVNGDGTTEIVYTAGGKVLAKLPDDTVVWESPPVEIASLAGVEDLDGDGVLDVVGIASSKVYVVSGKDGSIEWQEADGEMGTVGGVRIGDLDGDGHPEVFIDECGCCGVNSGSPGVTYSFAGGFAAAVKPLWISPTHSRCGAQGDTLADVDGDGKPDLAYSQYGAMMFVRGSDGAQLGVSAATGTRADTATCDAANVDGKPGDEVICYQDIWQAANSIGGRSVWAATWNAAQSQVTLLWQHSVTDAVNGRMRHVGNSLVSLDDDGQYEVVVSQFDGTSYTTYVYDAATGATLASQTSEVVAAIVDLDGDGKPEIVTSQASSNGLTAWKFARATSSLTMLWTLAAGPTVLAAQDWSSAEKNANDDRPLALDLDGDGVLEPVLLTPARNGNPAALVAYKAKTAPSPLASYTVPMDVTLLTHDVYSKVNRAYDQILVARNDGYLVVLDNALAATNILMSGEFSEPGMRIGGYYSGAYGPGTVPIAPRLDGTADSVVVVDSRGTLERIDASGANLAVPPTVAWSKAGHHSPVAAANLVGGQTGLACFNGQNLVALDDTGKTRWTTALGNAPEFEPLPGDVNGDGVPDLFAQSDSPSSVASYQVYDGLTGKALWASPLSEALQWGSQPFSVADWNADGAADLVTVLNTLRAVSGKDGTQIAQNATFLAYFVPAIGDVDGDGVDDVTLSGGYYPTRTFAHDLVTQLWTAATDDRPYPFGARAVCAGTGSVWVQSSLADPGQVRLTTLAGAALGQVTTLYLAGGAAYPDAATAQAAGKHLGVVGNATLKGDLTGAGTHPSALLGSTDGWLYAVDPCAGTVDWAYDFHFPVGEAIFADTNGDGLDDIVVTAADGYLYGLSQQILAQPDHVWDVDPPAGITSMDVDTITTTDTLYGSWGAVAGADSYEIAVLTTGGSYVTQPPWQNVGNVTQAEAQQLPLAEGKRYFFAVRAVSTSKGASTEAVSNGVTVHLGQLMFDMTGVPFDAAVTQSDAGTARPDASGMPGVSVQPGCGCAVGARNVPSPALAIVLLLVIAIVRRRNK